MGTTRKYRKDFATEGEYLAHKKAIDDARKARCREYAANRYHELKKITDKDLFNKKRREDYAAKKPRITQKMREQQELLKNFSFSDLTFEEKIEWAQKISASLHYPIEVIKIKNSNINPEGKE